MKIILRLLFLSILTVFNPLVTDAAVITFLPSLDINGTSYDVTIHVTGNYENIWGSSPSSTTGLGSGGSLGSGPEFWNNGIGASHAGNAIRDALGTVHTWNGNSDSVMVPYGFYPAGPPDYDPSAFIQVAVDWNNAIGLDYVVSDEISPVQSAPRGLEGGAYAFASFEPSQVPVPGAVWLLGSGFIGLVGIRRKLKK